MLPPPPPLPLCLGGSGLRNVDLCSWKKACRGLTGWAPAGTRPREAVCSGQGGSALSMPALMGLGWDSEITAPTPSCSNFTGAGLDLRAQWSSPEMEDAPPPSLFKQTLNKCIWCRVVVVACGIQFPDQGLNLGPLRGECGVLTAGPPGKSRMVLLTFISARLRRRSTMPISQALQAPLVGFPKGALVVPEPTSLRAHTFAQSEV